MARKRKIEETNDVIENDNDNGEDCENDNDNENENGEDCEGEQICIPGTESTVSEKQKRPRMQKYYVVIQGSNDDSGVIEITSKRDFQAWINANCEIPSMEEAERGILRLRDGGTVQPIVGRRVVAKSTVVLS